MGSRGIKQSWATCWARTVAVRCLIVLGSSGALASNCEERAKTDLEKAYCAIIAAGEGAALPSLEEFGRNDVLIQRLLLTRPAERAGVPLPAHERQSQSSQHRASRNETKKVSERAASSGKLVSTSLGQKMQARDSVDELKSPEMPAKEFGSGCEIEGMKIRCGSSFYQLAINQPNHMLDNAVLTDQYQLGLPSYEGDPQDEAAIRTYLAAAYEQYISKMLALGLGGSTMSYTAFYYTFERHLKNNTDFSARFETMFEFLKKDKKSIGLSGKPPEYFPGKMKQCDPLGVQMIVCSDEHLNWVYTLAQ